MSYRSDDPVADHARHVIKQALEDARRVRTLSIDDVLSTPVDVDGLDLDAHVTVVIRQRGTGPMEVDYLDIRSVHLQTGTLSWGLIELFSSGSDFRSRYRAQYERFEAAVEKRALELAEAASDHDWTLEEMCDGSEIFKRGDK